ncbi:uncharacterized protein N7500_001561 [Penicillium coprophilum]|uniref:uncharacterized protein n=1 Tax=Penicillium coprophilum TaxID=36646 RepID=UPI0023854477|nr:uncharacterized protein N7500_001561 [Penicillium coprophilum]KAJ5173630.1 hypothetical protein N7500_001561 [Penicillium coprophilum]
MVADTELENPLSTPYEEGTHKYRTSERRLPRTPRHEQMAKSVDIAVEGLRYETSRQRQDNVKTTSLDVSRHRGG